MVNTGVEHTGVTFRFEFHSTPPLLVKLSKRVKILTSRSGSAATSIFDVFLFSRIRCSLKASIPLKGSHVKELHRSVIFVIISQFNLYKTRIPHPVKAEVT